MKRSYALIVPSPLGRVLAAIFDELDKPATTGRVLFAVAAAMAAHLLVSH